MIERMPRERRKRSRASSSRATRADLLGDPHLQGMQLRIRAGGKPQLIASGLQFLRAESVYVQSRRKEDRVIGIEPCRNDTSLRTLRSSSVVAHSNGCVQEVGPAQFGGSHDPER